MHDNFKLVFDRKIFCTLRILVGKVDTMKPKYCEPKINLQKSAYLCS